MPRTSNRPQVLKKWKDAKGTRFTLSKLSKGYDIQSLSKSGDEYNVAYGSTPKKALAHLTDDDAQYPHADKDPLWAKA